MLTLLLVGSVAGLISGLLGVAGFPLYVPLFMTLYGNTAPSGMLLPMILANAFAVVLINCLVAWARFHRHGTIHYPDAVSVLRGAGAGLVLALILAIVIGTIAFADRMFGIYLIAVASGMYWSHFNRTKSAHLAKRHLPLFGFMGGVFAGTLGFNGGSFFIPLLRHAGHDIKSAIATAMVPCAVLCLLALATLLIYGAALQVSLMHLKAVLVLALASTLTSLVGTHYKHHLSPSLILVGVVLSYMALGLNLIFRFHG